MEFCLLYTSDAADEEDSVDLGGRRIIKKKRSSFIFDKKKSTNLIRGYESIRKLNGNEKKYFNVLCRGSALRYLLTRAYDYLNTPKNAIIKIKDPKEYIKKLNFHRQVKSYNNYIN